MNKEQEDLLATGIGLLIKSSDKLKDSTKEVWLRDHDELFLEVKAEPSKSPRPKCSKCGVYKELHNSSSHDFIGSPDVGGGK